MSPAGFRGLSPAGILPILLTLLITAAATASGSARPIESITIQRLPVFPETTGAPNPWYMDLVNRLHVQTRPWVIRRELLFHVGEPTDSTRITESERILRERGIFESVRIRLAPGDSGNVVTVRAQDLWTLGIITSFDKTADLTSLTLGIRDTNLLGSANYLLVYHTFSTDQDVSVASVAVPRIGRHRAGASMSWVDQEDARSFSSSIGRGVENRYDRFGWGVTGIHSTGSRRFFHRSDEIGKSPYEYEQYGVYAGRFRGEEPQWGAGMGWIELRESPHGIPEGAIPDYVPPAIVETHVGGPVLFTSLLDRRYRTATNLERYGSTEDVPTGWSAHLAFIPNIHRHDDPQRAIAFRSSAQIAQYLHPRWEAACEISGLAFIHDDGRRGEQLGAATGTVRWTPTPMALSIVQGSVRGGRDRAESELSYLGSDSGLRGFPSREFTTRSTVLATLEQRFWTGAEFLWTGIGFNLFTDTARPSMDGRFDAERWRTGWGFGMLLGPRKSFREPVRIELAWRTDRSAAPTFSITTGTWLRIIPPLGTLFPVGDPRSGLR